MLTIAVIVALPGLAACGSNAPSKQEFLAKADPICQTGDNNAASTSAPTDLNGIKDFSAKLAANAEGTAAKLEKLKFPSGKDGAGAKDMVAAMKSAAAAARGVAGPVDKADYAGIETAAAKTVDAFKAADDKARTFGSTACAKGESDAAASKLGQTVGGTVKAAYIAKADALCKAANDQLDALPDPNTFAELKDLLDKSMPIIDKLQADFKAIPGPTTDKAKLDEVYSTLDALIAKFKDAQAAAAAGDQRKAVTVLNQVDEATTTANAKADAYGFKDCGSDGS
jgi:hypothetical protein